MARQRSLGLAVHNTVRTAWRVLVAPLAARLLSEMGEAMVVYARATADDRLTPVERVRLEREVADVERVAGEFRAALRGGRNG